LDAKAFAQKLGSRRALLAVSRTRGLTRADLLLNRATAPVEVDPGDGTVTLNGERLAVAPQSDLPLNRSHFLA
jgi:urease subunit alpha